MALPLYIGGDETEPFIDKVFDYLVENLPDNYIVADQGTSGVKVQFARGPNDYIEYGAIVLAPGIAVQVQMCPIGDLLSFDDSDPSEVRIEYLSSYGRWEKSLSREPPSRTGLQLRDVVDWLAEAEDVASAEVRRFFSKVKTVETMVLSNATTKWHEGAAQAMGFERHHTMYSVVNWLQELEDRVVFQDSEWTEERARALFRTLGVRPDSWDRIWGGLEEHKERRAKQAEVLSDEGLEELVSRRYPFPLAFSMRRFDTEPGYPEKLRCAENVLAYLGSLGIALARDAGLQLDSNEGLGEYLRRCWRGGVSAGDWVRILRETTGFVQQADGQQPVPEFPSVYRKPNGKESDLGKLLKGIPRIRNDFYHHRYPTSFDQYEEAGAALHEKLMTIYSGLRLFEAYPLWYVTDCRKMRGSPLWHVTYKLCTGDNPQFRTLEAEVGQYAYEDSLYLKTPEHLVDLTPWLVMRTCPECGSQAMFFVEKIDSKREQVTYKSFNRGHTHRTDQGFDLIAEQLGLEP